jgi:adenylosuccinate synthase
MRANETLKSQTAVLEKMAEKQTVTISKMSDELRAVSARLVSHFQDRVVISPSSQLLIKFHSLDFCRERNHHTSKNGRSLQNKDDRVVY